MASQEKESIEQTSVMDRDEIEQRSVMDRDKNSPLSKDLSTHPINKSSTVIEKDNESGTMLKSTPVKMYSLSNVLSQATPPKGLPNVSTPVKMYSLPNVLSQATPPKGLPNVLSETTPSKETKSMPLMKDDFTHIQGKLDSFCDDLDTEIKACLYSASINDKKDLSKSLERLRRKSKAFHGQLTFSLDQCVQKSTAMIQKVSSLEQCSNHLRRERDLLQSEVTDLKRQKETQEIEALLLQSDEDDEVFGGSPKKAKTEEP